MSESERCWNAHKVSHLKKLITAFRSVSIRTAMSQTYPPHANTHKHTFKAKYTCTHTHIHTHTHTHTPHTRRLHASLLPSRRDLHLALPPCSPQTNQRSLPFPHTEGERERTGERVVVCCCCPVPRLCSRADDRPPSCHTERPA